MKNEHKTLDSNKHTKTKHNNTKRNNNTRQTNTTNKRRDDHNKNKRLLHEIQEQKPNQTRHVPNTKEIRRTNRTNKKRITLTKKRNRYRNDKINDTTR